MEDALGKVTRPAILPSRGSGWHYGSVVSSLIEQFRSEIHGQLSDRRRVIDHLLDVRQGNLDHPGVVAEVDRLLADVPGLTTVENTWWVEALDDLDQALALTPR